MVLGTLQIVLGGLCGLKVATMATVIFSRHLPHGPQGQPLDMRAMIPAMLDSVPIAVGLIWLGIGMLRLRRWAWTLTVVISWRWLILGLFAFVMVQVTLGYQAFAAMAEQDKMPREMATTMRVIQTLIAACMNILLPALFLILCHNQSVRATCFQRDAQPCWTDRCPMPVLAISVLLAL